MKCNLALNVADIRQRPGVIQTYINKRMSIRIDQNVYVHLLAQLFPDLIQ